MNTHDITRLITEVTRYLKATPNHELLERVRMNHRTYDASDIAEFIRDLSDAARKHKLLIVEQRVSASEIDGFVRESKDPLIVFRLPAAEPDLLVHRGNKPAFLLSRQDYQSGDSSSWLADNDGYVRVLVMIRYEEIVGDGAPLPSGLTPTARLFKLFGTEKKDISYVLVYALIIGLLSLALPLGLQTTIEFISGGVFFSSVYILIGLVILGVAVTGVLQIVQLSIVEQIQRRLFVRAALEFAYKIPRIRLEALAKSYAPELVNRFFDVITIQKGLPKLLLDLSAAVIQIMFGLLLLSLYHPFFVFFSLFLVGVLTVMFYVTGPRGLQSSINESKYKYKVVQWLEEIARTIKSFKLAGNTDMPMRKTDQAAGSYVAYRRKHFGVLITQFSFFVFFKVAITGGLLIMGTVLVVDRQITLGQFVASEVIIVLVLNAVEKMILYTDVVYDLLTGVDKVSQVTDLPLEKSGLLDLPRELQGKGCSISLHKVSYAFDDSLRPVLEQIDLEIAAGEKVCIAGPGGSGKSTLANIVGGLYTGYSGGVAINKFSMRDLDIMHLRSKVAKNISPDDIFDGTIYENITVGRPEVSVHEVMEVLEKVGLSQYMNTLPNGLNTTLVSGGKGLPSSTLQRIILARCLNKKPELVILNDFFSELSKADKLDLIRCVINPESSWTLLAVSNDPLVMAACDRVVVLDGGKVVADDSYQALLRAGIVSKYFE